MIIKFKFLKKPRHLVPFTVLQKQEQRKGVPNAENVAFIRHIEVLVHRKKYTLEKKQGNLHVFTVNGQRRTTPYRGRNGEQAIVIGDQLVFTTKFGLTILWDGNQEAQVLLCDTYRRYVCGLCGNADGNPRNDFVDPNRRPVALKGHKYTRYFNWGSKWRVPDSSTNDEV
jgi:hypothetical protein